MKNCNFNLKFTVFILLIISLLIYANKNYPNAILKKVYVPFKKGQSFKVHQGEFGKFSHHLFEGMEYAYDFETPYGTKIIAVEDGEVIKVFEPKQGGGCDKKYSDLAHNIQIKHDDETIAIYVHTKSDVKKGQYVKKGTIIGRTAKNGWICDQAHLHFQINRGNQSIPLYFFGFTDGKLKEGRSYITP